MWVAVFKVWHHNSVIIEATKKLDAQATSYYLNLVRKGGKILVNKVLTASGRDKGKLIEAIKKDPRLKITHIEGDQVFYQNTAKYIFHSAVLNSSLFFIKPDVIKEGFEWWYVASWDKDELMKLYSTMKKLKGKATIELISIKKQKVNVFVEDIFQELTEKQFEAFKLCWKMGYYSVPRKMSLEEIAEKLHLPFSTFRDRIRAAESKIMGEMGEKTELL
ncbi:MAG: helix-turn-helix domain-containing protein [Candidatus Micrarchaeota archaeon]